MNFFQKIIRCTVVSVCALALAACGSNGILAPKAPNLNKQLEMTADVSCGDDNFSISLSRNAIGKWQAVLLEPYEVQGIGFNYSRGEVSASLEGISAEKLTSDFDSSPLGIIISSLENALQDNNGTVTYADGGYTVRSGDCILAFEQGSAAPISIEISKARISAKVRDFTVKGDILKDDPDVMLVQ